jgi:RNA polymerase sigma-70 factor (ECF subfamily)
MTMVDQLTDSEMVARAKAGDLSAFEDLTNRYEARVYTLARRILRHDQDAEDVTQEAFLSALEHLAEFREEAAFSTWLFRIATFGALKVLRKRKGLPTVSLDEATDPSATSQEVPHPDYIADWRQSPEELVGRRETAALLETALNRLDEKHRLVFLLRDVEGLSVRETSEALGLSEANVKVRLLRARLDLREYLTRKLGDPTRVVKKGHASHD